MCSASRYSNKVTGQCHIQVVLIKPTNLLLKVRNEHTHTHTPVHTHFYLPKNLKGNEEALPVWEGGLFAPEGRAGRAETHILHIWPPPSRRAQPFGISGLPWKKSCLGPHIKYIVTRNHKKISSCFN